MRKRNITITIRCTEDERQRMLRAIVISQSVLLILSLALQMWLR